MIKYQNCCTDSTGQNHPLGRVRIVKSGRTGEQEKPGSRQETDKDSQEYCYVSKRKQANTEGGMGFKESC